MGANGLRLVSSVTTFALVVAASEPIIGPLPLVGSLAFMLVGCGAEVPPAPPTPALPTPVVAIGPAATAAGATAPEPASTAAPPPTSPPADDIDRTALALDRCAGRWAGGLPFACGVAGRDQRLSLVRREPVAFVDRDVFVDEGLEHYSHSLRRKLIFGVYLIPLGLIALIFYLTNYS